MTRFAELAHVTRGGVVESVHLGVAVVADAEGRVRCGWGDPELVTYPRSAMKPIQALALVESGAADAFGLTERHLALACASHDGEPRHTELAGGWLADIGCGPGDLVCGAHPPKHGPTRRALMRDGAQPSTLHHNCSGKHAGFLTVCRHMGWSLEGYDALDHPAQRAYADALAALGAAPAAWGVDGCALPTPALSMADAARAAARWLIRQPAAGRLVAAMAARPDLVSGAEDAMVRVADATRGRVLFKVGAEGFLFAWVRGEGLAVALKIVDGAERARVPVLLAILRGLGALDEHEAAALRDLAEPAVFNARGEPVGAIRAAPGLDAPL